MKSVGDQIPRAISQPCPPAMLNGYVPASGVAPYSTPPSRAAAGSISEPGPATSSTDSGAGSSNGSTRSSLSSRRRFSNPRLILPSSSGSTDQTPNGSQNDARGNLGRLARNYAVANGETDQLHPTPNGVLGARTRQRVKTEGSEPDCLPGYYDVEWAGRQLSMAGDSFYCEAQGPRPPTPEEVSDETAVIVKYFFFSSYQQDSLHNLYASDGGSSTPGPSPANMAAETPAVPELYTDISPYSREAEIGRRLAAIGDEINERYSSELDGMARQLLQSVDLSLNTAYAAFKRIASRLFERGINWGRIAALLNLGYRIAMHLINRGFRGFLDTVVGLLVRYIVGERIAQWIAEHGGWAAVISDDGVGSWEVQEAGGGRGNTLLLCLSVVLVMGFAYRRFVTGK